MFRLLHDAWQRFATYDVNANRLQKAFRQIQFWILVLGLIVVFLVVFQKRGRISLSISKCSKTHWAGYVIRS